jgi:lipoyl(octanoyl) transferase
MTILIDPPSRLTVQYLGLQDFTEIWQKMQRYTAQRDSHSSDQVWFVQHSPIYTLGLNRKDVRMPSRDDIPVLAIDRGGKITYHGPGQLVMYTLIDLKRKKITVRQLVSALENAVIHLLAQHHVIAMARADAPGVYVQDKKIASVGLRLKQERSYHGLSLNVNMDLSPFSAIDPCGYQGLQVTQMHDLEIHMSEQQIAAKLLESFAQQLGYQHD